MTMTKSISKTSYINHKIKKDENSKKWLKQVIEKLERPTAKKQIEDIELYHEYINTLSIFLNNIFFSPKNFKFKFII